MSEEQQSGLSSTIMDNITRDISDKLGDYKSVITKSDAETLKRICDTLKTENPRLIDESTLRCILDCVDKEIVKLCNDYERVLQQSKEYSAQLANYHSSSIEDAFTRIFQIISYIIQEHKEIDFNPYVDDLKKIAKSSGMTIYYYREGEIVPEEDNSIIQFDYQKTNLESLNDKVSSCELIGFRLKDLDLKHSGKVTIYKYDASYIPHEKSEDCPENKTEQFNIDEYLTLEQTYWDACNDHYSEVCSHFKQFDSFEKINSEQILEQCVTFANLHPDAIKKGRLQKVIGDHYESIGEKTEAKKWHNKAKKHGNNIKKGMKKEKRV